jgi:hypothetical protein
MGNALLLALQKQTVQRQTVYPLTAFGLRERGTARVEPSLEFARLVREPLQSVLAQEPLLLESEQFHCDTPLHMPSQ